MPLLNRLVPLLAVMMLAIAMAPRPAQAAPVPAEPIPGQLIVRYQEDATPRAERRAQAAVAATRVRSIGDDIAVLRVEKGGEARALSALRADPAVRIAVQDGIVRGTATTPNDPLFPFQYGLRNTGQEIPAGSGPAGTVDADISADRAWDIRTSGATVAIIDSGVDFSHPDLGCNQWTNPGESGGGRESDGIDDDGNGFVDDWRGWDFIDNDNDPTNDGHGHGTHVAGTVAACGNNGIGVTGVAWSAPLMAVRVLGNDNRGPWSGVLAGFDYAGRMGARVANASLGGIGDAGLLSLFHSVTSDWPDTLFALAAGNDSANLASRIYVPCEVSEVAPNAICVQSNDNQDKASSFTNYGPNATISAPGTSIASTWPNPLYVYLSGTSMATPHVAGTASLISAERPALTGAQMRTTLEANADAVAALTDVPGNRRLNAHAALLAVHDDVTAPADFSITTPQDGATVVGQPVISWIASSDATGISSYQVIVDGNVRQTVAGTVTSWQASGIATGTRTIAVRASDSAGNTTTTPAHVVTILDTPAQVAPQPVPVPESAPAPNPVAEPSSQPAPALEAGPEADVSRFAIARGTRFSRTARVALGFPVGASSIRVADNAAMRRARTVPARGATWTFAGPDGTKRLHARFVLEGRPLRQSAAITVDRGRPSIRATRMNIPGRRARLTITARDSVSGVASIVVTQPDGARRSVRGSRIALVLARDARVRIEVRDRAGNVAIRRA